MTILPSNSDLPADFGRYRLLSVLGEGGMARVYRAERIGPMGFRPEVALKVVKRKAGKKTEFVSLLTREAVIGGFLRHPNIVATLDFDQVDQHYYISMEFVEGTTLEDLMRVAVEQHGRVPPLLTLDIVQQVCRGLHYAHGLMDREGRPLQIIHRDIKPGNIMVSHHGVAKITDFGIAKAAVETGVVTATNVVRGTPLYMSPEQATGRPLDHRSDLFAVGLILYELLTGKRLFEMKDIVSTMESIARADVGTAPAEVDAIVPGMGRVLRKLLQLHPRARHEHGEELERDLGALADALEGSTPVAERGPAPRDALKSLTSPGAAAVHPGERPAASTMEDSMRLSLDLDVLEELDGDDLREMSEKIDRDAPTRPFLDPVIRRTSAQLQAVLGKGGV